jgi:hypothetical protein
MNRRMRAVAETSGRELARRPAAIALLTALPLSFYAGSHGGGHAIEVGGVAMAFSVSGAAIFAVLSARRVDQRLVLAGYRPLELLLGRCALLEAFGAAVGIVFTLVMLTGSHPSRPWALLAGVELVALVSVPFGLAVGSLAPGELEAVLIMIGTVGIELSLSSDEALAKALPFGAPRQVLDVALGEHHSTGALAAATVMYAAALLALAAWLMSRRTRLARTTH